MKAKTKKRLNTLFIISFIAAVAVLYAHLYLIPSINGSRKSTEIIGFGKLEKINDASCLVIRQEQVVTAGQSGTLSYYVEEGSKTRIGTKILDIYPAGRGAEPYYCPVTGFVSYYIDGYESEFTMDEVITLEPEYIQQTMIAPEDTTSKTCEKDDPIYKLITSDEWYMVLAVDSSYSEEYTIGQSIEVRFGAFEEPKDGASAEEKDDKSEGEGEEPEYTGIPATVTGVFKKENGLLVAAKTRRYYEDLFKTRFTRVKVVTRSDEGLLIPQTAVAYEEGQAGVYELEVSGEYSFVPIEILVEGEGVYMVRSDTMEIPQPDGTKKTVNTVAIYDEILRNAEDHQ